MILIDWSYYSSNINYICPATKVEYVGQKVANRKKLTLVGHSLGAHVVGIAGYNTKHKVNYIVGNSTEFLQNKLK